MAGNKLRLCQAIWWPTHSITGILQGPRALAAHHAQASPQPPPADQAQHDDGNSRRKTHEHQSRRRMVHRRYCLGSMRPQGVHQTRFLLMMNGFGERLSQIYLSLNGIVKGVLSMALMGAASWAY
eukprot:scaffold388_cov380-Prasinococcus_capsulatus_cf.AAC.15